MDLTNQIILMGSLVLLASVLAGVVTRRLGVPLLLVFLLIGMLMGEEGPGGIEFKDVQIAHLFGSLALAIILFDGGMRTPISSFRVGLRPALGLATIGVMITAGLTGAFAAWWLELNWMVGLLLGAIVGSTDAAAVFSLLHSRGLELKQRVGATLEIESGSNDPMAIFLTIAFIEVIVGDHGNMGLTVLWEFVKQMGLGAVVGLAGGLGLAWLINRLEIPQGLYPLAAMAGGLSIFGVAAVMDGSGFLAIYLAGLLLGNRPLQAAQYINRFHDGIAQLAQIGMFLMLGLLVTPSELVPVAVDALLIAAVLILVARPIAVWLCLLPFRFPWREQAFVGWVGLRGAVPIILALFPFLAGIDEAEMLFNIVFFVVLISLLVQGWTVSTFARLLKLEVPPTNHLVQRVELDIPGQQELELVGYRLMETTPVVREKWTSFTLPRSVRIVAHLRDKVLLDALNMLDLRPGDYLYLMASPHDLKALDRLFVASEAPERLSERQFFGEFVLNGVARLDDLSLAYGIAVPEEARGLTLDEFLRRSLNTQPVVGDRLQLTGVELVVREVSGDRIIKVGLKLNKSR
ncbi:sodium:proton exchanger [Ectothiorhodospira haloalkaliphila]|uniref:Sodium:proton exchanger n=1 Tax=Ectothiorhodospira haloalkaliphila TaxID=421628 RepID=W8KIP5_9GAMM|nr:MULTISPECIES: potassium/proton antiporter [Ectothiorhodospira]AHK79048.1 sodium:proton exchanger [Ectothiorhodospira haloalkaliphila]MCG5494825.1 potassium/proton antiporter [Ectothiorhodospira variabilis]MCG5497613.1 potassium/proton antiporter [Ectothiorhodospira variabilis]MCG5504286.1 potassium/proton antiporter [Ectothiorhodospira variabilis]MCG5507441.1 potassium/proton antiporter [Ectothiorhodospira variabilis]